MNAKTCALIFCLALCGVLLSACEKKPRPPGTPGTPGTPVDAEPVSTFAKSYGDDRHNSAVSAIPTRDGGYAFVGHWGGFASISADASASASHDAWLVKLNANGDVEWQTNIGERSSTEPGRSVEWKLLRRTSDGGFVQAGTETTRVPMPGGIESERKRIIVRKLNAGGNLEWESTHASGSWRDYQYIPNTEGDTLLEARDTVQDVWESSDGSYWVAGLSIGSVRADGAFEENEDPYSPLPVDHSGRPASEFHDADSIVVWHLNSAGELMGTRRFTEGQFLEGQPVAIVRSDAQGRVLLVRRLPAIAPDEPGRGFRTVVIVDRLAATLQSDKRFAIESRSHINEARMLGVPVELIQTDDVELDSGTRDYVADDGYLLLLSRSPDNSPYPAPTRLVKLDHALELEWEFIAETIEGEDPEPDLDPRARFRSHTLVQVCAPTIVCRYFVGGEEQHIPRGMFRATLLELDEHGRRMELYRLRPPVWLDPDARWVFARVDSLKVAISPSNQVEVHALALAYHVYRETWVREKFSMHLFDAPRLDFQYSNDMREFEVAGEYRPNPQIPLARWIGEDHFLVEDVIYDANTLQPASSPHLIEPGEGENEEVVGLVEVAPGSFVLAINSDVGSDTPLTNGRQGRRVWLLRVTDGRIDWQKFLHVPLGLDAEEAVVRAIAPGPDGGFALHIHRSPLSCAGTQRPGEDHRRTRCSRYGDTSTHIATFSASGDLRWTESIAEAPSFSLAVNSRESLREVAGGYLIVTDFGRLARVPRDGSSEGRWVKQLRLSGNPSLPLSVRSLDGIDADADGSYDDGYVVLVTPFDPLSPFEMWVMRLDENGNVLWTRKLNDAGLTFENLHIRGTPDGGFLFGADSASAMGSPTGTDPPVRLGQRNLTLTKFDPTGDVLWVVHYGGLKDEVLADLEVLADGGILVASSSDSMGVGREAWILRLAPDGTMATSCQAQLSSDGDSARFTLGSPSESAGHSVDSALDGVRWDNLGLPGVASSSVARSEPVNVARHCSGTAYPPSQVGPIGEFTLTVEQAGSVDGVVTSTPSGIDCGTRVIDGQPLPEFCSARFPAGTVVTLRADVGSGTFLRWDRACADDTGLTDPVCIVVMDDDQTIPVAFGTAPPVTQYTLNLDVQANGGVSIDASQTLCREGGTPDACERTRAAGTSISLFAVPDGGYVFSAWTGDCAVYGDDPGITLSFDRNLNCGATFELTFERTISVTVTGPGRVHDESGLINCRQGGSVEDCRERYVQLQTVTLTAVPDPGHTFQGWGGNCTHAGTNPIVQLDTLGSHTCSAVFAGTAFNHSLTVQIRNGSLSAHVESQPPGIQCTAASGSDCSETYPAPQEVMLRASPATDFLRWDGCDEVVDVNFCRMQVSGSRTVTAEFVPPTPP